MRFAFCNLRKKMFNWRVWLCVTCYLDPSFKCCYLYLDVSSYFFYFFLCQLVIHSTLTCVDLEYWLLFWIYFSFGFFSPFNRHHKPVKRKEEKRNTIGKFMLKAINICSSSYNSFDDKFANNRIHFQKLKSLNT